MGKHEKIQLFNSHQVRSVWDDEREQWYFAVSDVVQLLTDCKNVTDYIKKMRKRDPELAKGWGQIVTPLSLMTNGGRQGHTVISSERAIDRKTEEIKVLPRCVLPSRQRLYTHTYSRRYSRPEAHAGTIGWRPILATE